MLDRIAASLDTLTLGETASVAGVRVRRGSLLGFQVAGGDDLLDARQAARRIAALARARSVRIALCGRCGGDGLGRRNRGVCGLCRGPGVEVIAPPVGWDEAPPPDVAAALQQAIDALAAARYPRAQASLAQLIEELAPRAPEQARRLALDALARRTAPAPGLARAASRPPPRGGAAA